MTAPSLPLVLFAGQLLAAQDMDCPALQIDEHAVVKHVFDGDTVLLDDGRKVRLIGIDTPELAYRRQSEQRFAEAAHQALQQLIEAHDYKVSLQIGNESRDRYQRLLAHLFTRDGLNLNAEMLRKALAVAYTTPPNDRLSQCYHQLDRKTAERGRHIWSHPRYHVIDSADILDTKEGFHRIRAHINHVAFNGNGAWLYADRLGIHIVPGDLSEFDLGWLTTYEHRSIILRGWVRRDRYRPASRRYFRLRHPDNIEAVEN